MEIVGIDCNNYRKPLIQGGPKKCCTAFCFHVNSGKILAFSTTKFAVMGSSSPALKWHTIGWDKKTSACSKKFAWSPMLFKFSHRGTKGNFYLNFSNSFFPILYTSYSIEILPEFAWKENGMQKFLMFFANFKVGYKFRLKVDNLENLVVFLGRKEGLTN
jgi:hypothetical protein